MRGQLPLLLPPPRCLIGDKKKHNRLRLQAADSLSVFKRQIAAELFFVKKKNARRTMNFGDIVCQEVAERWQQ